MPGPLLAACLGALAACASAAAPPARNLNVPWHQQDAANWCWAASTEMIVDFMTKRDVAQYCQAVDQFGRKGCAPTDLSGCDRVGWPQFEKLGFRYSRTDNCALSWDRLRAEIDAGRPVAASWHRDSSGGHMEVVTGYYTDSGTRYVTMLDPDPKLGGEVQSFTYASYASQATSSHWHDFFAIERALWPHETNTGSAFCASREEMGAHPAALSPAGAAADDAASETAAVAALQHVAPLLRKRGMLPTGSKPEGLRLDSPFKSFFIRLADVTSQPEAHPAPTQLLQSSQLVIFPLLQGNETVAGLTLQRDGGSWAMTSFGVPFFTKRLAQLRADLMDSAHLQPREVFQVEVPGLGLVFLGYFKQQDLYLALVDVRPSFGLNPGEPRAVADVLAAIRQAAIRQAALRP